jgi:Rod binding domain-containing protein
MAMQIRTNDYLTDQKIKPTDVSIKKEKLQKACMDFEGVLLNNMLQTMQKSLSEEGLFGKSHAKKTFESMYYQELSAQIANDRGMGLGDMLYDKLQRALPSEGISLAEAVSKIKTEKF